MDLLHFEKRMKDNKKVPLLCHVTTHYSLYKAQGALASKDINAMPSNLTNHSPLSFLIITN